MVDHQIEQGGRKLWLTRHGQSAANTETRLGGNSGISDAGAKYANILPAVLLSRISRDEDLPVSIWTSTLRRTIESARQLPFPKLQWKALDEIDAGICDGMTYQEVARDMPDVFNARKRDKLRYRYPAGESYMDLMTRLEPVITEIKRQEGSIMIVAHQAVLRVIYGYFTGCNVTQIPGLDIPLHTLIELAQLPDGSMSETRFAVDVEKGPHQFLASTGCVDGNGIKTAWSQAVTCTQDAVEC